MSSVEIDTSNWTEVLDDFDPQQGPLTATVREHLSIEGQSAMRRLRDHMPPYLPDFDDLVVVIEED